MADLTARLFGELAANAYEVRATWLELSAHLEQVVGVPALAAMHYHMESYDFAEAQVELLRLLAEQPKLAPIRDAMDASEVLSPGR